MQISRYEVIQQELAVVWDDGTESYIGLERLRRACPCATCQGETDVMGRRLRGPEVPLSSASFEASRIERIGGYALQVGWADGHSTGLYGYDLLRQLGVEPS
ncbi:MAG: DUF971 domain-containing protein [Verrucomicrobiae bacterium]|nr:DUF971 domain-containing protein [Verrucomicrobiae bacterium]